MRIYVSSHQARTVRDARSHVRYTHPAWKIVRVRRVDPMDASRGFVVDVEAQA